MWAENRFLRCCSPEIFVGSLGAGTGVRFPFRGLTHRITPKLQSQAGWMNNLILCLWIAASFLLMVSNRMFV